MYNNKHLNNLYNIDTGLCPNTPSILPENDRIIARGDIHGDLNALILALRKAGIVDSNNAWIGGNDIVVQVGDIFDRGGRGISVPSENIFEEIDILSYLYNLNKKARKFDGRVISLIGNHELMNMCVSFQQHKLQEESSQEFLQKQDRYN